MTPRGGMVATMPMMQMMATQTTTLASFLFHNLNGYRFRVVIAIILAVVQVCSDLLLIFPLKIILDKLVNHRNPPFVEGLLFFRSVWDSSWA